MRKGRNGEKKTEKTEKKTGKKKKKIRMKIVATTSLPAVDRPNADRWNAAGSRQLFINSVISKDRAADNYLLNEIRII